MLKINFKMAASSFAVLALSACGGGGSDSTTSTASSTGQITTVPAASTAVVGPMTKYAGTWQSDCDKYNNYFDTATIKMSNDVNSATATPKSDTFAGTACTGGIIATETSSPDITLQFVKTLENASITMLSGQIITASIDVINFVALSRAVSVTGSAVTQSVNNGINMWDIALPGGGSTSVPINYPAKTTVAGLFFLNGKFILLDSVAGSSTSFTEDSEFVKISH